MKTRNLIATLGIALCLSVTPTLAASVEDMISRAEQGDVAAQSLLGGAYFIGKGVPQDYAKAAEWSLKAARKGDVAAQSLLSGLYYYGYDGVPKDLTQAARWASRAAEQGNASAQLILGYMYYWGDGVLKDKVQAHMWFTSETILPPAPMRPNMRHLNGVEAKLSKIGTAHEHAGNSLRGMEAYP